LPDYSPLKIGMQLNIKYKRSLELQATVS